MILFALLLLLLLGSVATAMLTATPLFRMLSIAIDSWADGVHGEASELL